MHDAETVIEEIRTDAATDAAITVAGAAAVASSEVALEVAEVGDVLEAHVEESEERHEEILGDTEWIRNLLGQLSMTLQTIVTAQTAMAAAMTAEFQAVRTAIESRDTPPLPLEPVAIPVVEPVAVADPPEVKIETPSEAPKRRRRVI